MKFKRLLVVAFFGAAGPIGGSCEAGAQALAPSPVDVASGLAAAGPAGWVAIALAVLGALVSIGTLVAPLTKTQVDDKAVGWLRLILDRVSVLKDRVGSGANR